MGALHLNQYRTRPTFGWLTFWPLFVRQYDFAYDKRHSVRPKRNIRMAMQTEVAMYAACQKDERGLDKVVEDGKYRMKRYGVTPNLLVRCYYFLNCSVQPNP